MTAGTRPRLAVWFELASTYSYLAVSRVEALAAEAGVALAWRPFLLGPIFAAQGWSTSPFNLYPAKGRYMWRDMEREAARLGLPFRRPAAFPQASLLAARIACLGQDEAWGPAFVRAVYRAEFADGRDIGDADVPGELVADLGLGPASILAQAGSQENKARLRAQTEEAARLGIFGAPSFVAADGELFWGNDRLEAALAHAAGLLARRSAGRLRADGGSGAPPPR